MADIELTQNARLPSLYCTLYDYTGTVDLTSASGVKWVMMDETGANKVDAAGTIVTPATQGLVRYDWAALDVNTPGRFYGQWEITISGLTQNYPSDRYLVVEILENPR